MPNAASLCRPHCTSIRLVAQSTPCVPFDVQCFPFAFLKKRFTNLFDWPKRFKRFRKIRKRFRLGQSQSFLNKKIQLSTNHNRSFRKRFGRCSHCTKLGWSGRLPQMWVTSIFLTHWNACCFGLGGCIETYDSSLESWECLLSYATTH